MGADVCSPIQQGIALGDRIAGELSDPSLGVVEKANGGEVGSPAHVKPVLCAGGHAQEIIGLAEHLQHLLPNVKAKQATALNEEAHFVFAVHVFGKKSLAQRRAIGMLWCEADRIHRGVGAARLDARYFGSVGGQDVLLGGPSRQLPTGLPALKTNAPRRQHLSDGDSIRAGDVWQGLAAGVGGKNLELAHRGLGRASSSLERDTKPTAASSSVSTAALLQALTLEPGVSPEPAAVTLVGVGPGDPELLTVAAVRAIAAAATVAYPVAQPQAEGMAAAIAAPWIAPAQRRLPLLFPMVPEAAPRLAAWRAAAAALAAEVAAGRGVVLLCEGDASLYASCSYALIALTKRHPACPVRVVPGITAVAAAAAAASGQGVAWPLVLQQENLLIRPTPDTPAELDVLLKRAAAEGTVLALLKLGHRWVWLRPVLEARGLLQQALFARRVGWPDQLLAPAARVPAEEQPYFSLLLLRQSWPSVLP